MDFMDQENWTLLTNMSIAAYPKGPTPPHALLILLILPLFGIFVALLTLALETRQQPANSDPTFAAGATAKRRQLQWRPTFELPLLDGVTLVSPSDYAGRPLFLNFWATWCQPCVRELPAFEEFIAEHSADENGPALLTINLGETAAEISGFLGRDRRAKSAGGAGYQPSRQAGLRRTESADYLRDRRRRAGCAISSWAR